MPCYMGKFGGRTPKPHTLWGNDFRMLSALGAVGGTMTRQEQERCVGRTCRTYVDKNGVKRHVGKKKELSESQCLILQWTGTFL